jgi:hypothetical protein
MSKTQKNWRDYTREDPEIQARFVISAFARNPHISNLGEFKDALMSADRINRASGILDEMAIKDLFDSEDAKSRIRQNLSQEEFEQMYDEVDAGTTFIQRQKPLGQHTTAREIKAITITRPSFSVEKYTKLGKEVKSYSKTYSKWTSSSIRFLRIRKMQGISTRDIAWQYNNYFKQNARSPSSIATKLHRIRK